MVRFFFSYLFHFGEWAWEEEVSENQVREMNEILSVTVLPSFVGIIESYLFFVVVIGTGWHLMSNWQIKLFFHIQGFS